MQMCTKQRGHFAVAFSLLRASRMHIRKQKHTPFSRETGRGPARRRRPAHRPFPRRCIARGDEPTKSSVLRRMNKILFSRVHARRMSFTGGRPPVRD